MKIADFVKDSPKLHKDAATGEPVSYGIVSEVLEFIEENVSKGSRTIETGAGISSIGFLICGCQHTAVCPEPYLRDNILGFCCKHGINTANFVFVAEKSQDYLPSVGARLFDCALLDGEHAFPIPQIDFYYLSRSLKVGGILLIDDIDLWSCEIIHKFLYWDYDWQFLEVLGRHAVAYRKRAHRETTGWGSQRFVVANSISPVALSYLEPETRRDISCGDGESSKLIGESVSIPLNCPTAALSHLKLSAILCTFNRGKYLQRVFESIVSQTVPSNEFEVVVVDDGSTDNSPEIVQRYVDKLPIVHHRQENMGLAAARNQAIKMCSAPIVLFMDDDDIATPTLFEEHLKSHERYPEATIGVLGYTDLDPAIARIPLMNFVTEVGCYLFGYPRFPNQEFFDYTYFWGGRSSCKRALLQRYGLFNPIFRFGYEDIELGYRLSKVGFRVVYNKKARSTMIRGFTFDEFCRRIEIQGRSGYVMSRLHQTQEIEQWADVANFEQRWAEFAPKFSQCVTSARLLEALICNRMGLGLEVDSWVVQLLHRAYWLAFDACRLKGTYDMAHEQVTSAGTAR